jgi:hypothetical protein
MKVSDEQINRWASAPSETENEKCENAISQVTEALRAHFGNDVTFIRQGSHTNRTNIKIDSDVDIAVVHNDFYFPGTEQLSPADKALYEKSRVPASYKFSEFKDDVHAILRGKFGSSSVERRNKCVRVAGNSNRVNADVVPAYEHKRYRSYGITEATGIAFMTDKNERVNSFPKQHYANGVGKNDETAKAYKAVVRILKNVRGELADKGVMKVEDMPSFFIESLAWNVPLGYFKGSTWRDDAGSVALKIWSDMRDPAISTNYSEVSDLMWLFRGQKRTPKQAEDFMLRAWDYVTT